MSSLSIGGDAVHRDADSCQRARGAHARHDGVAPPPARFADGGVRRHAVERGAWFYRLCRNAVHCVISDNKFMEKIIRA